MKALALVFMTAHALLIRPGLEALNSNTNQQWFWASSLALSALILAVGVVYVFRVKKHSGARAVLIVMSVLVAMASACCFMVVALIYLSVSTHAYSWSQVAWVSAQGGGIGLASIFIAPSRMMLKVQ